MMSSTPSIIFGGVLALLAGSVSGAEPLRYYGMCDASAAAPLGDALFVVASDEDSVLRSYQRAQAGGPVQSLDMRKFLAADDPETDLEGATRIGDRVYWIGSHGRNADAALQPSRRRFFATDIRREGNRTYLVPVGKPYRDLLRDLAGSPALKSFDLARAAERAPEAEGGLNIEALTRTPAGALLIGFRNPIPGGKALLVPLENPDAVVAGAPARLGRPLRLDLGGLGIRSIEYSEAGGTYFIVAGRFDDAEDFRLYRWSGSADAAPVPLAGEALRGLRPEALIVYPPTTPGLQVLSDDGGVKVDGKKCKKAEPRKQFFLGRTLQP